MSRIGKKPVAVADNIEITLDTSTLKMKGPKGELSLTFEPEYVSFTQEAGALQVNRANDTKAARARHGLYRSLAANMVEGVTNGFAKTLEIKGVGYRAALKGKTLEMNLGFSHPVIYDLPEGVDVSFDEKNQNIFTISGIDKQQVGQVASEIRSFRKPEPYKGKGVMYLNEDIARKAGKSAKAA